MLRSMFGAARLVIVLVLHLFSFGALIAGGFYLLAGSWIVFYEIANIWLSHALSSAVAFFVWLVMIGCLLGILDECDRRDIEIWGWWRRFWNKHLWDVK